MAFLVGDGALRAELRADLARAPDMARALSRIAVGRAGPRDLAALRDGLDAARSLATRLAGSGALPAEIGKAARLLAGTGGDLVERLAAALADDLPLLRRDGGFVRAGFHAGLDEARELGSDSRRYVAALQARYAERPAAGRCGSSTTTCSATSSRCRRPSARRC